jgi:signal transduction histidine kinase
LKTILDPFIQVQDNSLTAGARGTGLGLSIVMSFVELDGGKVRINSIVDQGTEVLFNIPPSRLVVEDN